MSYGKVLKIFVMGKDARSLKSVELVNWTGQAFLGRRDHLSEVKTRSELKEPGIYILLNEGVDESGAIEVYIGETDNFSERLIDHSKKPWWNQFVVFVSKDKNLTKAHVKYLEKKLFTLAQNSLGTLSVKNLTAPGGSSLPESDVASMEEFLENIIFVLETLSLTYFSVSPSTEESKLSDEVESALENMQFYLTLPKELGKNQQLKSHMYVKDGVYILKKGSFIRKHSRESFSHHSYFPLWEQITKSNAVEESTWPDLYITTRDIEFRSPSGAAAIVRGGQTNGRTDWKRIDDDKQLFECEMED